MNMNEFQAVKVAIGTNDGHKLIGYIVEPKDDANLDPFLSFMTALNRDGVWLQRERKLTFLSRENIIYIREAKPFEKEIDGMGK